MRRQAFFLRRKRFPAGITGILLFALLLGGIGMGNPCSVLAGQEDTGKSPDVVSAYFMEDTLYSFFAISDEYADILPEVSLSSDLISGSGSGTPILCSESGTSVSWLLLIDDSNSMSAYRQRVTALAEKLMDSEDSDANVTVTVASYGASFAVLGENLTTRSEVVSAISGMNFSQRVSDISGGLVEALEYLTLKEREPGECVQIVLLTDGEPYTANGGYDEEAISSAAEEAASAITGAPETIVHSVCFGDWEQTTEAAVTTGTGLHLEAKSITAAGQAGESIAEYGNALYTLALSARQSSDAARFDVQYRFSYTGYADAAAEYDMTISTVSDVGNLELVKEAMQNTEETEEAEAVNAAEGNASEDTGEESAEEEPGDAADSGEEDADAADEASDSDGADAATAGETADSEEADATGETTDGEEADAAGETADSEEEDTDAAGDAADSESEADSMTSVKIGIGILIALAVLAVIILLLICRKRAGRRENKSTENPGNKINANELSEDHKQRDKQSAEQTNKQSADVPGKTADAEFPGGICMKLEFLNGKESGGMQSEFLNGKEGDSMQPEFLNGKEGDSMQPEFLNGKKDDNMRQLYLKDEIRIGSGAESDLVLTGEGIPDHCARIYFREGLIYIEDLNKESRTLLNGMKIHAANRLRSGDEVTVDNVKFRLWF